MATKEKPKLLKSNWHSDINPWFHWRKTCVVWCLRLEKCSICARFESGETLNTALSAQASDSYVMMVAATARQWGWHRCVTFWSLVSYLIKAHLCNCKIFLYSLGRSSGEFWCGVSWGVLPFKRRFDDRLPYYRHDAGHCWKVGYENLHRISRLKVEH